MTKEQGTESIQLTRGQVAIIDDIDVDLAGLGWYARKSGETFYAVRSIPRPDGKQTAEYLHQRIAGRMGIAGKADHKDRDGRNNRRDNLRPADDSQNQADRARQKNNTSGYKGVSWKKAAGKYVAQIRGDAKKRHLGYYDGPIEAAKAYDRAAQEAFGEFAVLNFPGNQNE